MLGSRILKAFMENRSYNAAERIMMCALIALSGTFFFYDYYQSFAEIARIVITVLIFVIWFLCALCAGKDRQWSFMVFGYMYWAIPYIYMIFYNSRDNVRDYSKWLSLFNKIADMFFAKPFEFVAEKLAFSTLHPVYTLPSLHRSAAPTLYPEYGLYAFSIGSFARSANCSFVIKSPLD